MEEADPPAPVCESQASFQFGPYVPIIRIDDKIIIDQHGAVDYYYESKFASQNQRLLGEIFPDDRIVDAPSLVTPLLLKKKTVLPPRVSILEPSQVPNANGKSDAASSDRTAGIGSPDDIQVVKVVTSTTSDVIEEPVTVYREPEEYIKASVVSNLTNGTRSTNSNPILAIQDYYKSSAADLLISIGINRIKEYILEEKVRVISKKMRNGAPGLIPSLEVAGTKLIETKRFNAPYSSKQVFSCHHCAFKTDLQLVLDAHLESPHQNAAKFYSCNWCNFKTKDSSQIVVHNHVVHKKFRSRIERPLSVHCCRYCPFESNSKRKFTSHIIKCEQTFQKELVQAADSPTDYPAITSKLITQQDVKVYESTLISLRLAAYNPHQVKISSPAHGFINQPILLLPKHTIHTAQPKNKVQQVSIVKAASPYADLTAYIGKGSAASDKSADATADKQDSSHLMRLLAGQAGSNNLPHNRVTMLQYPRPQSVFVNGMSVSRIVQGIVMAPPQQTVTNTTPATDAGTASDPAEIDLSEDEQIIDNPNGTFVICEICDSYIEDLVMFKSHMNAIHKVKIHHKLHQSMRPPLNCQKCDWRFFTDQGLERHLLGSHGLVTTNMQELADNDKDSGRCSVCGMRCARRLVAHMKDFHKMMLRPAQLSYKCTVCTATFSLYRYFENHVYRIHADAIRDKT